MLTQQIKAIACVLLVTSFSSRLLVAEDGILSSRPTFQALVLEAMAARGAIGAGAYSYEVKKFDKSKADRFKVREVTPVWEIKGNFKFDDKMGSSQHDFIQLFNKKYHNSAPWGAASGSVVVEETKDHYIFRGGGLLTPELTYVFPLQSSRGFTRRTNVEFPYETLQPMDVRSFGFAFYGDIVRNRPFEAVLGSYLRLDESAVPELKESKIPKSFGKLSKSERCFNYGGCMICIDPSRGFWATRTRYAVSKSANDKDNESETVETVFNECTIYLKSVNDHWVPSRTIYKAQAERIDISINWEVVNPPDDSKLVFSIDQLSQKIGKSYKMIQ